MGWRVAHAVCSGEPTDRPLADIWRAVNASHVRLLDEGFADHVHHKAFGGLDVRGGVLEPPVGRVGDGERHQRRVVGYLYKNVSTKMQVTISTWIEDEPC